VCWVTRSKATKYELLLSITKDLQNRDKAICQWQRLFDVNLKTANEAAQKFQELRSKAKISRSLMKKVIPRVSGIIFIRYAQNRKIGKPNNLKLYIHFDKFELHPEK
jgi:hypothetical protein